MMRILLLILPILLSQSGVNALALPSQESLARLFVLGNAEYQKGDYVSAERYYRRILDAADSGPVFYNLGNACFKQKRLGEAIYYWEKAQQKLPADTDLRENLELANLLIVDRVETPQDPFPLRLLAQAQDFFTITQASWLVFILFIAANALLSVYLLAKSPRIAFGALAGCSAIGLLILILGCSLAWKIYDKSNRQEGVVIEQKVDVRSGPGHENITVFTIHEGIRVRVRRFSSGWYQVSLPNGWSGWLQQSSVLIL